MKAGCGSRNSGTAGTFAEKERALNWNLFDLRTYDGRTGRFHNPDPMWQYASPYMAMGNNPLSVVDPTGGEGSEGGSCPHSLVGTCCECEGTCPTGNSSSNSNGLTWSWGDGQGTSGGTGAPKLGAADLQDLIFKSNNEEEIHALYLALSTVDNWIYEARASNIREQGLANGTVGNLTASQDGPGDGHGQSRLVNSDSGPRPFSSNPYIHGAKSFMDYVYGTFYDIGTLIEHITYTNPNVITGMPPDGIIGGPLKNGDKAIRLGKILLNRNAWHTVKDTFLKSAGGGRGKWAHIVGTNPDIDYIGGRIVLAGRDAFRGKTHPTEYTLDMFIDFLLKNGLK